MSDVDPDVAATMAHDFEQKIKEMRAKARTSTMTFIFKDDSELVFEMSPNPNSQAKGTKYSLSNRFAASVKEFRTVENGFEFVFQDDSRLSLDAGKSVTSR